MKQPNCPNPHFLFSADIIDFPVVIDRFHKDVSHIQRQVEEFLILQASQQPQRDTWSFSTDGILC